MLDAADVRKRYEAMCAHPGLYHAGSWRAIGQELFDAALDADGEMAVALTDRSLDCAYRAKRCELRARGVALGAGWRAA